MSNLRLINETEVTSTVSFLDVTDVFSSDYDIYKVTVSNMTTDSTTATALDGRFITTSGTVNTSTKYHYAHENLKAETTFTESKENGVDEISDMFGQADQSAEVGSGVAYIYNPYLPIYTYTTFQNTNHLSGNMRGKKGIGVYSDDTIFTGFRIVAVASDITSGVVRTYGLRVD